MFKFLQGTFPGIPQPTIPELFFFFHFNGKLREVSPEFALGNPWTFLRYYHRIIYTMSIIPQTITALPSGIPVFILSKVSLVFTLGDLPTIPKRVVLRKSTSRFTSFFPVVLIWTSQQIIAVNLISKNFSRNSWDSSWSSSKISLKTLPAYVQPLLL